MRFARSTVSQEGAEKNTISTNIQYSPLQVLPEVQTQKVFEGEAFVREIFWSQFFFSPEIQLFFFP